MRVITPEKVTASGTQRCVSGHSPLHPKLALQARGTRLVFKLSGHLVARQLFQCRKRRRNCIGTLGNTRPGLDRVSDHRDGLPRVGRHEHCGLERSEEHTSELQSLTNLVCRLLLEKKNNTT